MPRAVCTEGGGGTRRAVGVAALAATARGAGGEGAVDAAAQARLWGRVSVGLTVGVRVG